MGKTRLWGWVAVVCLATLLAGCGDPAQEAPAENPPTTEPETREETSEAMKLYVQVGGRTFPAAWEDNEAAAALQERLAQGPMALELRDYAGFEKVGPLGETLPTRNRQITTRAGDIVLYQGDQIVVFYGTNTWQYTPLAHVDDLTGWAEALGGGDVTVTFSLER